VRDSGRAAIVKAYNTVRGSAAKHVKAALPALGALVQKYMGLDPRRPPRRTATGRLTEGGSSRPFP
jgi:hypothetical protein